MSIISERIRQKDKIYSTKTSTHRKCKIVTNRQAGRCTIFIGFFKTGTKSNIFIKMISKRQKKSLGIRRTSKKWPREEKDEQKVV